MKHKLMVIFLTLSLLLAACGGGAAEQPASSAGDSASVATQPAATPTPAGPRLTELTRLEQAGLAFRGIPGYTVETEPDGFVTMKAPDADEVSGPGIVMMGGANRNGLKIADAFALFTESFDALNVLQQESFFLNGNSALRSDFEATAEGQAIRGRFVAAATADNSQIFLLLGLASPARWAEIDPYITAVAESVSLFAPVRNVLEVRQWAIAASESKFNRVNEFSLSALEPGSMGKAIGKPVEESNNCQALWSEGWEPPLDEAENTLLLEFARPVHATQVNVHMLGGARQLKAVRVINTSNEAFEVYSGDGFERSSSDCAPLTFDVGGYPDAVAVEVVMNTTGISYFESVDAVELVGEVPAPQPLADGFIEQWASEASSDASRGDPKRVLGPANLWRCNLWFTGYTWTPDYQNDPTASLTVKFDTPVTPESLNIYHASWANPVVRVVLIGEDGSETEIYSGAPDSTANACPDVFSVAIAYDLPVKVVGAVITTDQSLTQSGNDIRTNIDAVKLVGKP